MAARVLLLIGGVALLLGCTMPGEDGTPAAVSGGAEAPAAHVAMRWSARPEADAWTQMSREAVDEFGSGLVGMVPADIAAWCPGYPGATPAARRDFWVGLLSALSRWESNFRPEVRFTEDFPDSSGQLVVSRGLLQISQESANGYRCGIADAEALHDPQTNLACGVRILNKLVVEAGVITSTSSPWRGASAYWSPFRRPDRRADMAGWTSAQAFCQ
jgi:hypothetical protein